VTGATGIFTPDSYPTPCVSSIPDSRPDILPVKVRIPEEFPVGDEEKAG
jgi:hypothetical protein